MATLTLLTMDLMKGLMMHIILPGATLFWITTMLYFSHLLQDKTLDLPQILGHIYT